MKTLIRFTALLTISLKNSSTKKIYNLKQTSETVDSGLRSVDHLMRKFLDQFSRYFVGGLLFFRGWLNWMIRLALRLKWKSTSRCSLRTSGLYSIILSPGHWKSECSWSFLKLHWESRFSFTIEWHWRHGCCCYWWYFLRFWLFIPPILTRSQTVVVLAMR